MAQLTRQQKYHVSGGQQGIVLTTDLENPGVMKTIATFTFRCARVLLASVIAMVMEYNSLKKSVLTVSVLSLITWECLLMPRAGGFTKHKMASQYFVETIILWHLAKSIGNQSVDIQSGTNRNA